MATFFHGNPEIQATDGLQTLVLMNPSYVQYPDTPPPPGNNFVFLNSNSLSPHAPPTHTQQFVGIPLPTISASAHNPSSHDISPLHGLVQRVHYNMYNPMDPSGPARDTPRAQQGLSLSLSSQQQPLRFRSPAQAASGEDIRVSGGGGSATSGSVVTSGGFGMQGVLLGSKYLKAAQELLDEVVNVNKTELAKKGSGNNNSSISKAAGESSAAAAGDRSPSNEAGVKRGSELSTAERQEIQMKKGKLISMLDEVEQRYRQYHHQMQIIINSFEQTAGVGSAKTYTALALQTISKQFRCLKDAITGQIGAANKSLGEEDSLGGRIEGSRLKFVDNQLRQQRALQQLGMIQHNAWRPQRGLPERSVSVLRSWLFEHFLHPYPKDADKVMLAKQTGLTRNQVSNWFINARVRLWKPMVEEMYTEEIKEREQNESEDKTSKSQNNEDSVSKSSVPQTRSPVSENHPKSFTTKQENSTTQNTTGISICTATTSPMSGNLRNQTGFSLIGSSELEGIAQRSPKKQRSSELLQSPSSVHGNSANKQISMTFSGERLTRDGYSFMGNDTNFIGGFGQYPIGEITRFDAEQFTPRFSPGNGVSLTLGLPHCENLSLSGTHQTFLPNQNIQLGRRVEMSEPNEFGAINPSTTSAPYENISIQNRKRFSAHLLPDFVS